MSSSSENLIMIAVPSKGRFSNVGKQTLKHLNTRYPVKVVVEPQEYIMYKTCLGADIDILVLPKNDAGLMYSVSAVCSYAIKHGYKYVWKIDDDINKPTYSANGSIFDKVINDVNRLLSLRENVGVISFYTSYTKDYWNYINSIKDSYIFDGVDKLIGCNSTYIADAQLYIDFYKKHKYNMGVSAIEDTYLACYCKERGKHVYNYANAIFTHKFLDNGGGHNKKGLTKRDMYIDRLRRMSDGCRMLNRDYGVALLPMQDVSTFRDKLNGVDNLVTIDKKDVFFKGESIKLDVWDC